MGPRRPLRPLALPALCLLLLGPLVSCATAPRLTPEENRFVAAVRPATLREHIRTLADDRMEGRATGTRGYDLAASYVAGRFREMGLEPGGTDGYLQPVPMRRGQVLESRCRLLLRHGGGERALVCGQEYAMSPDFLRERSEIAAPAVFAGFGVTAPRQGYDDYAQVDAKGKVVVLLSGAPPTFPHNERAYYSSSLVKEQNAAAHGAVGILTVMTPVDERRTPWERLVRQSRLPGFRWLEASGAPHDARPQLVVTATLSRAGAEAVLDGAPRTLGQAFATADSGRAQGFALPLEVRAARATRHDRAASPNVAGVLRGADPARRGQFVVYTAHLDHLGISAPVSGDSINNGAYDNASGIAVMLEIARVLAQSPVKPRRSLLFVAVTGEEKGMQGSAYFARFPTVPADSLVADLNLDMVLMLRSLTDVVVFGGEHSSLEPVYEKVARALGVAVIPDPMPEEVTFIRSDQYSFVRRGVPSVFPVAGPGPTQESTQLVLRFYRSVYHTPQDDLSQSFDYEAGAEFARLNLLAGWRVANAAGRPVWNQGDFFGEKFGDGRGEPKGP